MGENIYMVYAVLLFSFISILGKLLGNHDLYLISCSAGFVSALRGCHIQKDGLTMMLHKLGGSLQLSSYTEYTVQLVRVQVLEEQYIKYCATRTLLAVYVAIPEL